MIDNERFSKLKAISDPFPILVIENFLTKEEAEDGYKILTNSNFDEFVNDGRFNIRKGTSEFEKFIKKENIFKEIYDFFNKKSQFEFVYEKLKNTMETSGTKFKAENIPSNFHKNYYEYKRDIHKKKILKRVKNFIWIKTPKILKKIFNINYFEINFSLAKKGYKLKTHTDKKTRLIVFLLYLNDLKTEDGGNLEIYAKKDGSDKNFELKNQFQPKAGRLIIFQSNPISFHNVGEITNDNVSRCFCYGSYSSNDEIIWKKD